jgi:enterochelin esterase-like enzyme
MNGVRGLFALLAVLNMAHCALAEETQGAGEPARPASTAQANVHVLPAMTIPGLGRERTIRLYLPPGYETSTTRYPVLYMHDGQNLFDAASSFLGEWEVDESLNLLAQTKHLEIIVVGIDNDGEHRKQELTAWDNPRFGKAEGAAYMDFIVDVVKPYIDAHYRTIPNRNSRGLVGHSMGGYGASRIGMKHPDVFGSLYIMSPCCLSARGAGPANPANEEALAAVKTADDSAKLPFGLRAQLASAAAWSPNPNNPPLYLDLPIGPNQPSVLARWAANAPLAFIDQYIQNLRQYRAIAVDVGDQDNLKIDTSKLHDVLTNYGIKHDFEIYSGTHTSHVAVRFQEHVMPFFSRTLSFESATR